jgi:hypothetical protein
VARSGSELRDDTSLSNYGAGSPQIYTQGMVPTAIRFAHWINLAAGDELTMRVFSEVWGDVKEFVWSQRSESSWPKV